MLEKLTQFRKGIIVNKILLSVLTVIGIIGIYTWFSYNSLVTNNESINNQWAQIQSQYQRRFDLIPNLVESVKGTMKQEQKVFGDLAEARTRYTGAQTTEQKVAAATQVEGALSRLLAIMENYPQLKSSENVQTLMVQLEGTENRISVERKRYNDTVNTYNVRLKTVPTKWLAGWFGFSERTYFEAVKGAEQSPKISF